MVEMLASDELQQAPESSHRPRYVQSLQQVRKPRELADACLCRYVVLDETELVSVATEQCVRPLQSVHDGQRLR